MGADIKALKSRIRSVDSTLHLTSAMGLVASSKMRKANIAMQNGREYVRAFSSLVDVVTGQMPFNEFWAELASDLTDYMNGAIDMNTLIERSNSRSGVCGF